MKNTILQKTIKGPSMNDVTRFWPMYTLLVALRYKNLDHPSPQLRLKGAIHK